MKDGLYTRHEVACIIADLFGGTCACDYSGNDEWLPQYCEFAETNCPNVVGVACWEQYLKHMDRCSECGFTKEFADGHTAQYKYCPQCGRRISWEEEDET